MPKKISRQNHCSGRYAYIASCLLVFLIILLNVLFMFYDEGFYHKEYEKLDVYGQISKQDADTATKNMLDYLTGKSDGLGSFFNEREKLHLEDVRGLVSANKLVLLFLVIIISMLLILCMRQFRARARIKDIISRILTVQGLVMTGLLLLSFLLRRAFPFFFSLFHKIFFTNDLYLLNPAADNLIVLLPQQFFVHAAASIIIRSFFISMILLLIGRFLKKKFS